MVSTNYDTYRPFGVADSGSAERVIWMLVAVVLFLLSFFMSTGTGKDAEQVMQGVGSSLKMPKQFEPAITQEPNGANFRLMR